MEISLLMNLGTSIFSSNSLTSILEILLISGMIYLVLRFFRGTSAQSILTGIVILYLFMFLLGFLLQKMEMKRLKFIFEAILPTSILAIFIVFQPEIRRALGEIGGKVPVMFSTATGKTAVDAIIEACLWLAGNKMGALICIERQMKLGNIAEQGTAIQAEVSAELLKNIFFKDSPLHDGAVIIRGNRIIAAQCLLPMSDSQEISMELGTRHRAAVGLTEESDAVVIVVSEEKKKLSLALDGKLDYGLKPDELKRRLQQLLELEDTEMAPVSGSNTSRSED